MNERIRELEKQADQYEQKLGKGIGISRDEKFAELIVRECADYISATATIETLLGERLKEHFGVDK